MPQQDISKPGVSYHTLMIASSPSDTEANEKCFAGLNDQLTNKQLLGNFKVKCCLGCSDHEIVKFRIPRGGALMEFTQEC